MRNTFPFILFGGDYCPEQQKDEQEVEHDFSLMEKAKVNCVTLAVFSWALIEKEENHFDFSYLDHAFSCAWKHGIHVILATGTVAQPAWASQKYEDILPVDIAGRKRNHGMRAFFCVNSKNYRRLARKMAQEMATRYKDHPALVGFHIANEYGTYCYCENCKNEFRLWLEKRYATIDNLNESWYSIFWGRTYTSFDQIELPSELNDDYRFFPQSQLDYLRFMTDSTISCYENEQSIIREICPTLPVFTNISGFIKKLDQFKMVPHMDYAGWDNYPSPEESYNVPAMKHDIMRATGNDRSFLIAEQSPNQQNWQPYNKLKRPGEIRMIAFQGFAHGGDGSLFFQMTQSLGGQEMFHGSMLDRSKRTDTHVFREMTQLGIEIEKLQHTFAGKKVCASVGILFDWENWWAVEQFSGPSKDLDYLSQVSFFHKAFFQTNVGVSMLKEDSSFAGLKIIVAPMLSMVKGDLAERIEEFVMTGGIFLTTYLSGIIDENSKTVFGPGPGKFKNLLGLRVEETDALEKEECNHFSYEGKNYRCFFLCDRIHLEGAEMVATYKDDFYQGEPCITKRNVGKGSAWYLGTQPEEEFLATLAHELLKQAFLEPLLHTPVGVELTKRENIVFLLNHNEYEVTIDLGKKKFTNLLSGQKEENSLVIGKNDLRVLELVD